MNLMRAVTFKILAPALVLLGSAPAVLAEEPDTPAAGLSPDYADLQAEIRDYYQYHAEEELLDCLRNAKSDPDIRGTHKVGPRLKYLRVKQARYADFRDSTPDISAEDQRQAEVQIVELHMQQKKHIEHTRGLFDNGRETTNNALIEYHDTGCITGLEEIVEDIRTETQAAAQSESP